MATRWSPSSRSPPARTRWSTLRRDAHTLVNILLGAHLAATYACHLPLVNEALLVVSPEHFTTLKRGGVVSKEQLATCLWHCANRAASRHIVRTLFVAKPNLRPWVIVAVGSALGLLAFALSLLADLLSYVVPSIALYVLPLHSFVLAQLLKAPKFTSPTSFHILVAGANAGKFSTTCAGFGVGLPPRPTANLSMACSAKVEEQGGNNNKSYSAKDVKAKIGEISIGPRTNSYGLIDPTGAYPRTALNPLSASQRSTMQPSDYSTSPSLAARPYSIRSRGGFLPTIPTYAACV